MMRAQLFHNPGAGDEDHSQTALQSLLKAGGFKSLYTSLEEKNWQDIQEDVDFFVIAGGDGTVRRVSLELLTHAFAYAKPIGLLPSGTANNIGGSLGVMGDHEALIKSWKPEHYTLFDTGMIEGVEGERFFLESFGYGAFPYLIVEMHRGGDDESDDREKKIRIAQKLMHELLLNYQPRHCELFIDGQDYSGNYIMVEVMNTPALGPNLRLTPDNDLSDQFFEVVLVKEEDRKYLADYVFRKLHGDEPIYPVTPIKGKEVRLHWHGEHAHVDDKLLHLPPDREVVLRINPQQLRFLLA